VLIVLLRSQLDDRYLEIVREVARFYPSPTHFTVGMQFAFSQMICQPLVGLNVPCLASVQIVRCGGSTVAAAVGRIVKPNICSPWFPSSMHDWSSGIVLGKFRKPLLYLLPLLVACMPIAGEKNARTIHFSILQHLLLLLEMTASFHIRHLQLLLHGIE